MNNNSIKDELKQIQLFNSYSKDEQKLRTFLSLFYKEEIKIYEIIIELKKLLDNQNNNIFELYKKIYSTDYTKFKMLLNNYTKNSFHS